MRQNLPQRKVEISNDCWLDVLKFLACAQWSEKRYVSRLINGIGDRNISVLPRATIQWAILDEKYPKPKFCPDVNDAVVAFGAVISQRKIAQWFVDRGIILESRVQFQSISTRMPPEAFLIEKALLGKYSDFTNMCILGPAQENGKVYKSVFGQWHKKLLHKQESSLESVVFYSQFRPAKKFSWASLEQFLTFIFHPLSYIKKVEMFAVNQIFVDAVNEKFVDNFAIHRNTKHTQKSNDKKPPYIYCETFTLLCKPDMNIREFRDSLKWLERNVRADSLQMPFVYTHHQDRAAVCRILNNFVFGALRICAKRELRFHSKSNIQMIISLVEKFRSLPLFERQIPTIVIEPFSSTDFEEIRLNLGPNVIPQETDLLGAVLLYVFENGKNRMRISFCKKSVYDDHWPYGVHWQYDFYLKFYAT